MCVDSLLRPSCVKKGMGGWDVRERSESPQYQTYQRLCAGGSAGRPKAYCRLGLQTRHLPRCLVPPGVWHLTLPAGSGTRFDLYDTSRETLARKYLLSTFKGRAASERRVALKPCVSLMGDTKPPDCRYGVSCKQLPASRLVPHASVKVESSYFSGQCFSTRVILGDAVMGMCRWCNPNLSLSPNPNPNPCGMCRW